MLALLGVDLLLYAGLDLLHADAGSVFLLDGLFGVAVYLLLGLLACALVARSVDARANTRAVLVPSLAAAPLILVGFGLGMDLARVRAAPFAALALATVYLAVLAVRIVRAAFGSVRTRAAALAIALAVLAPALVSVLDLQVSLWDAGDGPAEAQDEDAGTTEPLFYEQPARIAAAVDRTAPSDPEHPGVYFLGFAGDGDQAIFRREALTAQQVFDARFGSGERSVLLVNDVDDRESYPIASVSGLQQALKLLAAKMDPDRDVLVLTLTSHGSREGIDVSNGSLPLLTLGPADLRQALDAAGIRWRVLVVSACYSGVFLEPLATETSLIITASDADHTSFGCEDDHELTDFGQAFLRDALPAAGSLEDAFARARELIMRRETQAHETHSNPQLFMGGAMRAKLAQIEAGARERAHASFSVRR